MTEERKHNFKAELHFEGRFSAGPSVPFDHDELVVILERNGFTKLRHRTQHDCGMTGYTRHEWLVDDEEGNTVNAQNAVRDVLKRRLYGLLTAEP